MLFTSTRTRVKYQILSTSITFISAVYIPAFPSIVRNRGSIPGRGKRLAALPAYCNGYRTVKLTIHVPLVPRLRMSGATPPLPSCLHGMNRHNFTFVIWFLLGNSPASEFYMPSFRNTVCSIFMMMGKCVPKRRHIKFGRRGITQKKAYNIRNTVNVWIKNFTYLPHGAESFLRS
jgi:hypothetical protein